MIFGVLRTNLYVILMSVRDIFPFLYVQYYIIKIK